MANITIDKEENAMEFTGIQEEQLDSLYDAADELLALLNPEYEHDMELCGKLVDAAEAIVKEHLHASCYPFTTEDENGLCRCDCERNPETGMLTCGYETCRFAL